MNMMLPSLRRRRDFDFPEVSSIFNSLWQDMDHVFDDTVKYQTQEGDLVYELEVPGFNKDNLSVEVVEGVVTIKGERTTDGDNYVGHKKVFKRLNIARSEDLEASISDGILKLTVKTPKKESMKIDLK